jgi:acetyl-CoA carboxylase biotin carboxylase subunit
MINPSRISKVAIANRGEVAVRIIRACQEMGLDTVLLHSDADQSTLAYRMADEVMAIGPAPVADSYLNIERNIQGALAAGAEAIHPGFGFLSENAAFAEACEKNRILFVGPTSENIRLFGDKISAKNLVDKIGIPTIPGYQGEDQDLDRLMREMERIGYPVMVKAAAGGGGRGLRVAKSAIDAANVIEAARREAINAFGNGKLFLEKYLDHAQHVEVQIFGDARGNVIHLCERECSIQRRHQKIIEEGPTVNLPSELRNKLLAAAVEIGRTAKYRNAGTVEFLVQDNQFYFMEMNTRLQVEHPVTEALVGVDLVKAQLSTAMDQPLIVDPKEIFPRGHAIECRIYAEDPELGGIPSTGKILGTVWPHGPGRRFEVGIEAGDEITSFYDSMIAKVIVWDETRSRAIRKMRRTLSEVVIFGVKTNISFLDKILSHTEFVEGRANTRFIERHFSSPIVIEPLAPGLLEVLNNNNRTIAINMGPSSGAIGIGPWGVRK